MCCLGLAWWLSSTSGFHWNVGLFSLMEISFSKTNTISKMPNNYLEVALIVDRHYLLSFEVSGVSLSFPYFPIKRADIKGDNSWQSFQNKHLWNINTMNKELMQEDTKKEWYMFFLSFSFRLSKVMPFSGFNFKPEIKFNLQSCAPMHFRHVWSALFSSFAWLWIYSWS